MLENALEIYWNKKRTLNTLKYIAQHYSIFDFLQGLGTYFETITPFYKYTLKQVYSIIWNYITINYSFDSYLPQLVTIDYYMNYKIKPQTLFYPEINKKEKFELINTHQLNHHNNRYIVLPINFDWNIWQHQNIINPIHQKLSIGL